MSETVKSGSTLPSARDLARLARRDRTMGRLILVFTMLIFAEGVVRKWLVPESVQSIFYFIREPALLAIYIYYLRKYPISGRWVRPFLFYAFTVAILALLQNFYWQRGIITPLIGIRFYTFYVPLAFIMADVITKEHLRKLIHLLLWASIPVTLLVFVQFSQPPTAWINKGTAEDGDVFTVAFGIVRPYGPFTFTGGQTLYSGLMAAVVMIAWERRRDLRLPFWLVAAASFCAFAMMSLGGSRSGIVYVGLVMFFYLLAGFTSPRVEIGAKRAVTVLLAASFAIVVFVLVFPRAFEAMSTRQATAVQHEGSTVVRALSPFTTVFQAFDHVPAGGYGIGAGTNASRTTGGGDGSYTLGETEWLRMINEGGPFFGIAFLVLRQIFAFTIFVKCVRLNRRTGDGSALILLGFLAPLLTIGQITSDNQNLTFVWFSLGLCYALLRHPLPLLASAKRGQGT